MPLTFHQPHPPHGRILARSGQIDVGAVFPPWGEGQHRHPWVWRLWLNGEGVDTEGRARTELAAKNALATAWRDFLARAGLAQAEPERAP